MPLPELLHEIVFLRTSVKGDRRLAFADRGPNEVELEHLKRTFGRYPISIYCLPGNNECEFALVGGLTENLVTAAINNGKRYDCSTRYTAERYVYYGLVLHPDDHDLPAKLKTAYEAHKKKGEDRFYAMILFHANIADPPLRQAFCRDIKSILEKSGWDKEYCLSGLRFEGTRRETNDQRMDFDPRPFDDCRCWLRLSTSAAGKNSSKMPDQIQDFHSRFKYKLGDAATTICFSCTPQVSSDEVSSREAICQMALQRFDPITTQMVWFGFKQDEEQRDPEIKLPLGNFVISAGAGMGKSNVGFAIMSAFATWQRKAGEQWTDSPSHDRFDVLYVNLKSENGAKKPFAERDEARLLGAVLEAKGLKTAFVRPADIDAYMKWHVENDSKDAAVLYTEPDESAGWRPLISGLASADYRKGRGLLVVVDEAFSIKLAGRARADIHDLYKYAFNEGRSAAVRLVLIGQAIDSIKRDHPEVSWVLDESTLVIGGQPLSEDLRKMIESAYHPDDRPIVEWLGSGDFGNVEKAIVAPYKFGPAIVRPRSFGTACYPIPCHIRPKIVSEDVWKGHDVNWWKPRP
jgi:hypothetical protein